MDGGVIKREETRACQVRGHRKKRKSSNNAKYGTKEMEMMTAKSPESANRGKRYSREPGNECDASTRRATKLA